MCAPGRFRQAPEIPCATALVVSAVSRLTRRALGVAQVRPRPQFAAIDADQGSARRKDWPERDLAIVFTALLAGLCADELTSANIGDIRRTHDGGVLHVHGKGNKDRRIPFGTV